MLFIVLYNDGTLNTYPVQWKIQGYGSKFNDFVDLDPNLDTKSEFRDKKMKKNMYLIVIFFKLL
jgi:hypothetical protein